MMKKTTIYISIIALFIPFLMNGQALKTSYFLDNSTTRHTLNPAMAPIQGYFAFPLLSSIGLDLEGNIGANSILFPLGDGGIGTFLHPEVTPDGFLNSLDEMSFLNASFSYDLLSVGWNAGRSSFWTIDLGVRLNVNSSIPKEFFSFLKNGMSDELTKYSINNFAFTQDAYTQLSLGYSQDIIKGLRVGGKVKVLAGIDNAKVEINSMDISMSSDRWAISADGDAHIMGKGVNFVKDEDGKITSFELNPDELGIGGFGVAFDLGVEYKLPEGSFLEGLSVSASVTDLGFISYSSSNVILAEVDNQSFEYEGFTELDILNLDISDELDAIQKEIFALASLKEVDVTKSMIHKLSAKVHVGVEYSFMKDMMSAGLLYTGSFGPLLNQNELTVSYNLTPSDWFGFALSYSFLNTGKSFGWLLNFTPRRGVNVFLGSDYTVFSFTPQGIPMGNESFLNAQLGISFPIGANNIRGKKFTQNYR